MGKNNIFFMTHLNFSVQQHGGIYILPSGNVSAAFLLPLVLQSQTATKDFQSGQECEHARAKGQVPYLPATSKCLFSIHKNVWLD